jgi:hypothetical protein
MAEATRPRSAGTRPLSDVADKQPQPAAGKPPDDAPTGQRPAKTVKGLLFWGATAVLGLTALTATFVGISAGMNAYTRAEQRANANNRVELARIAIKRAAQEALVTRAQIQATKADAQKRYQEAVGIRRAQDAISSTLTSKYLQYEAIQAQKAVATSGRNNTLVYLPSGTSGVPLVQDPQNVNRLGRP